MRPPDLKDKKGLGNTCSGLPDCWLFNGTEYTLSSWFSARGDKTGRSQPTALGFVHVG